MAQSGTAVAGATAALNGISCEATPSRTQGSFVLSSNFARQIIQDGGSTIHHDGATISAQKIEGL